MEKLILTHEERVFKTPRMEGVKVTYSNNNGKEVLSHTVIRSRPSVAIIVRRDDSRIALIQQFRSTTGQTYMEIPAGLLEEGESVEEAAIREVREETGYIVNNVRVLVKGPSLLDPSKSDEDYGVAVADAGRRKARALDEMEIIEEEVVWMEEEELFNKVKEQMFSGKPFFGDLFMSGHSLYAIMAYMLSKQIGN